MRSIVLASVCVTAVALTGCSTSSGTRSQPASDVSMATLGPVARAGAPDTYFFGAGDELGHQIFTVYVASLDLDRHYATGVNDFPSE